MLSFIIYELKVALLLAAFYLCFKLFLSSDNLHRLNRAILICTSVLSFILPVCIVTLHRTSPMASMTEPGFLNELVASAEVSGGLVTQGFGWRALVVAIYWLGVISVLSSVAVGLLRVISLIKSGEHKELNGTDVVVCEGPIAPFSWMKWIVMGTADFESVNKHIIEHEKAHVRLGHSMDVLLVNVLSSLQWFNPAIWLLKQDLKAIHEFEADDAVLKAGADIKEYQYSLIRKAVKNAGYSITNGFNHSILKNRITMMSTPKVSAVKGLKAVYILPLICMSLALNAKTVFEEVMVEAIPFQLVDVQPTFNGGDVNAFAKWVNSNLTYPVEAKSAGKQGRVTLQFTVKETGEVADVTVLRGVDPSIDAETVRVISSSPDWTPGEQNGRKVPVVYAFPVIFKIPQE